MTSWEQRRVLERAMEAERRFGDLGAPLSPDALAPGAQDGALRDVERFLGERAKIGVLGEALSRHAFEGSPRVLRRHSFGEVASRATVEAARLAHERRRVRENRARRRRRVA